ESPRTCGSEDAVAGFVAMSGHGRLTPREQGGFLPVGGKRMGQVDWSRFARMTSREKEIAIAEVNTASSYVMTAIQTDDGTRSPAILLRSVQAILRDRPMPEDAGEAEQTRIERQTILTSMDWCLQHCGHQDPLAMCLDILNNRLQGMLARR